MQKAVSQGVAAVGEAGHDGVIVQNNPINRIDPRGLSSTTPVVTTDPAYDTPNASGDPAYWVVNGPQNPSVAPYVNNDVTNAVRDNALLRALKKFPKVQNACGKVLNVLSVLDPFPDPAY